MGIYIGTISMGTIHEKDGQSIKTKFFLLGIPLFPISGFYQISKNQGIKIPVNGKSVWVAYSRFVLLGLGIVGLIFNRELDLPLFLGPILSLALVINGVYHWIRHWDISTEENATRNKIKAIVDYHMLPELLPMELRRHLFGELLQRYQSKYNTNWEEDARLSGLQSEQKDFLYVIHYYAFTITGDQRYENYYQRFTHA